MGFGGSSRQAARVAVLVAGVAMLAGCQSDNAADALDLASPPAEQVRASELRAFCPSVTLREGTAYFNTYERGGQDDPNRVVYQASIADVTRNCTHGGGQTNVNVAVAGRVVPGPKGRAGSVTMPIRVVMMQDGQVTYSKLHQHTVQLGDTIGATQFIFTDPGITIPSGPSNVVIFAGYDEGPPPRRR